ncbi:MAG: hypothetical protein A2Y89_02290 [Chloroflexi bacterium RBG_13_51_18]|nr:MAG: hypothetical protein A2Y89_02290 [Chloroflexi bacterium RBG_13_51_18]
MYFLKDKPLFIIRVIRDYNQGYYPEKMNQLPEMLQTPIHLTQYLEKSDNNMRRRRGGIIFRQTDILYGAFV